jgi:GTP-sensing pleiotropic transcriptional regulator CodY
MTLGYNYEKEIEKLAAENKNYLENLIPEKYREQFVNEIEVHVNLKLKSSY